MMATMCLTRSKSFVECLLAFAGATAEDVKMPMRLTAMVVQWFDDVALGRVVAEPA